MHLDYMKYIQNVMHLKQAVVVPLGEVRIMLNYIPGAASRVSVVKECPRKYFSTFICSTGKF